MIITYVLCSSYSSPCGTKNKNKGVNDHVRCDAGIPLNWHLQSLISIFISGHATIAGPHVKGQAGLRYHYDCMLPCGQAGRQAGWRAEDLNPCLEQSRSQAAGKLSSVPSFASAHFSLSYWEIRPCNGGHNCFVLDLSFSSPPLRVVSSQMKWVDTRAEHECLLSKSPMSSVSYPEANVSLAAIEQFFVGLSGSACLSPTYIW